VGVAAAGVDAEGLTEPEGLDHPSDREDRYHLLAAQAFRLARARQVVRVVRVGRPLPVGSDSFEPLLID
jgi:hypothetical protein